MSSITEWLSEGDLTSDGISDEVVRLVLADRRLLDDLVAALDDEDDSTRGHAADALEKITRKQPGRVLPHLPQLMRIAKEDPVPMVRWHMAMIFGHLAVFPKHTPFLCGMLLSQLEDPSVFTQSWAIVSLCILARQNARLTDRIVKAVAKLSQSQSAAIRSKVKKALPLLTNPQLPFPQGWVKSEELLAIL
jgi:hypothetical protein